MKSSLVLLPLGPAEEQMLIRQLRQGRADAYEQLYHRFVDRCYRLALGIVGDPMAAEDVVQESFMRVFRGIRGFRGQSRLGTWIHRITANVCFTELDRRKRRPQADPGGAADGEKAARFDAPQVRTNAAIDLAAVLAMLDPLKRATFYLHHVEGVSAREIAEILGDSREAVLKRLQRTRRDLVQRLREEDPDRDRGHERTRSGMSEVR